MTPDCDRLKAIKERVSRPRSMDYIYIASKYDDDVPWLVERLEEALVLLRREFIDVENAGLAPDPEMDDFLSRFEEPK